MRRGGDNGEKGLLDLGLVNMEGTNFIPLFCVFIEIRLGGRFSRLANFVKALPVTIEFGIIAGSSDRIASDKRAAVPLDVSVNR